MRKFGVSYFLHEMLIHSLRDLRQASRRHALVCRTLASVGADDDKDVVLYQAQAPRLNLMRSTFGFSSLHTLYWLWYSLDFVPSVNQSPIEDLHIDPMLGMAGLTAAVVMQSAAALYPKRLVHQLNYRPSTHQLVLYNYTLPLIRPVVEGQAVPVESSALDTSLLDVDLRSFQGHLALGDTWPPYLIYVQDSGTEIPDTRRLWHALVEPQRLLRRNDEQTQPQRMYKKRGTYRKGRR